jgi:hypothetical protein
MANCGRDYLSEFLQKVALRVAEIQQRLQDNINSIKEKYFPKEAIEFAEKANQLRDPEEREEFIRTEAKDKAKEYCPSKESLLELINKRNALAEGITQIQDKIKINSKTKERLQNISATLEVPIRIIKVLPLPTLSPGVTAGTITTLSDILSKLQINLVKYQSIACGLSTIDTFASDVLNKLKEQLNVLDILIEFCAIDSGIGYEVINDELNKSITEEGFGTYKGFTFEIKYDNLNQTSYPKRFAQALDKKKIVRLKSESSFASDPNVLIEELKFIIDTQNLKGD